MFAFGYIYMKRLRDLRKFCILCLLESKELCGYEIMKIFRDVLGRQVGSSFIYPTLRKMEKLGYIKSKVMSVGKRRKKVFYVTELGKQVCMSTKEELKKVFNMCEGVDNG